MADTKTDAKKNEIATRDKPSSPAVAMKELLEAKLPAMQAVATKHLNPEKLVKILGAAMSREPKLLRCTPMSVLQSALTLSELGLVPGPLGDAYLIPFENRKARTVECQLIIGYRGLVRLARRSGEIASIQAEVVRQGDEWELEFGLEPKFRHVPKGDTDAPIIRAWALARFKDGSHQLAIMSAKEVDAIRKRSRASQSGPWVTDYPEMVKKTVVRRLCKLLPLTPEVESMIAVADRTEFDFERMVSSLTGGASGLVERMGLEDDEEIEERESEDVTEDASESDEQPNDAFDGWGEKP